MKSIFSSIEISKNDQQKLSDLLCGKEPTVANLLLNIPANYEFATKTSHINNVEIGSNIIANVTVERHIAGAKFGHRFSKKQVYSIVVVTDDGMPITLVFFKIFPAQIQKMAVGTRHAIKGKLEAFGATYKIMHPVVSQVEQKPIEKPEEFKLQTEEADQMVIRPVYRMLADLSQNKIYKTLQKALDLLPNIDVPEWGGLTINKFGWSDFKTSITKIHRPTNADDIGINSIFRKRLAYDELLASQLSLQIARSNVEIEKHIKIVGTKIITNQLLARLPFKLTHSQIEVLAEIEADQAKEKRMFRLLQGDVGSGKTLVCLIACLNAIEAGYKAVIMAPTTILAMQHAKWINEILFGLNLNIQLLTSRTTAKQYKVLQNQLKQEQIDILIGTHSVINEALEMPNFGIIIVDEQHRFGVKQRLALFKKCPFADILMMTATPIPRTLAMMNYGDIDISIIKYKPSDRKPIDTRIISINKYNEIIISFKRAIENGEKIYWICPMIEESEKDDFANTRIRKTQFEDFFGCDKVGIIHGKMKEKERDEILIKFLSGAIKILVATTVVEVGINVPDATIIAIEQADRFGLSQLHQLRGRVGRSDKPSYCMLIYDNNITFNGKKRLKAIKDTEDGFEIAKQDLEIRGTGELIGTKQSGFGDFKIANLAHDLDLLQYASFDARLAMKNINSEKYLNLLQLFGYNEAIELLRG